MSNWLSNPVTYLLIISIASALITIGIWIGNVNSDRTTCKKFIEEIRNKIDTILGRLPGPLIAKSSPLSLSELGASVSREIGAKDVAKNLSPEIKDRVLGKEPYEVHDICWDYVKYEFKPSNELFKKIKAYAYEKGFPSGMVFEVIAIELRDILLKE